MHTRFLWFVMTMLLPISAGCTAISTADEERWSTGWGFSNHERTPRTDL